MFLIYFHQGYLQDFIMPRRYFRRRRYRRRWPISRPMGSALIRRSIYVTKLLDDVNVVTLGPGDIIGTDNNDQYYQLYGFSVEIQVSLVNSNTNPDPVLVQICYNTGGHSLPLTKWHLMSPTVPNMRRYINTHSMWKLYPQLGVFFNRYGSSSENGIQIRFGEGQLTSPRTATVNMTFYLKPTLDNQITFLNL